MGPGRVVIRGVLCSVRSAESEAAAWRRAAAAMRSAALRACFDSEGEAVAATCARERWEEASTSPGALREVLDDGTFDAPPRESAASAVSV